MHLKVRVCSKVHCTIGGFAQRHKKRWNFLKKHFTLENVERLRRMTAKSAGYHGAHRATAVTPATASSNNGTAPLTRPETVQQPFVETNNGVKMYYCWSHGLGKNAAHTSATCSNKKYGHVETATADKMQGGNSQIFGGRPARRLPQA